MIREPPGSIRTDRKPFGRYLAEGIGLLREDVNYRRLCAVQFLWSFSVMALPFYVPYAIEAFQAGPHYVGLFVVVTQLSTVLSNVIWAYVGHRKGNRALLVYGTYVLAGSIIVPLLAGFIPGRIFALWGTEIDLRIAFFSLAFAFSGVANSGIWTGRMTYILDIAPEDRRPTYTSFMNVFMLPQALLPIAAGALVALVSYLWMFLIALLFVPINLLVVHRLGETRPRVKS